MQAEVNADKQVAEITELLLFKREYQEAKKKKNQNVFQKPVVDIGSTKQGGKPHRGEDSYKKKEPVIAF